MSGLVSVCIACHNQAHLLGDAIHSCLMQEYEYLEIIVLDDASTDNVIDLVIPYTTKVKYFRSYTPSGTGGAFNKAIAHANGDIIVLLCADDFFTDRRVIGDIVDIFKDCPGVGHVSRFYHQFVHPDRSPVRAWRTLDPLEQSNNPSGLAFRKTAIDGCELSNKMFVEASTLVDCILNKKKWHYKIMKWDTVAVRIHDSISQSKDYYLKMWKSSPVEEWQKVRGPALLQDFTSLVQIKNNFKISAVLVEIKNFIKYRPMNLIHPGLWFYGIVSVFTPRFILRHVPHWYRITWGRWTTRELTRAQRLKNGE